MQEIKNLLKTEKIAIMAQELKEIEKYKEDFSKYYQVIRRFKGRKLKQQVKIYGSKFSHI